MRLDLTLPVADKGACPLASEPRKTSPPAPRSNVERGREKTSPPCPLSTVERGRELPQNRIMQASRLQSDKHKNNKTMATIDFEKLRIVERDELRQMVQQLMEQGLATDDICRWLWREYFILAPIEEVRECSDAADDLTRQHDKGDALDLTLQPPLQCGEGEGKDLTPRPPLHCGEGVEVTTKTGKASEPLAVRQMTAKHL